MKFLRIDSFVERFIFYPEKSFDFEPEQYGLPYEDVFFNNEEGLTLHGWFFPSKTDTMKKPVILFFHGNAGNISHRLDNVYRLWQRGLSVFIMDYQGYGKSEGHPSEKGTYKDARSAMDVLMNRKDINANHIVVFGRSLGGAVAIDLVADTNSARGLIIESTFTSAADIAKVIFPIIPAGLIGNIYESINKTSRIRIPVLQFHGTHDELIPFDIGQRLFESFPMKEKQFFPIQGATHNDTYLIGGENYFDQIVQFCEQVISN